MSTGSAGIIGLTGATGATGPTGPQSFNHFDLSFNIEGVLNITNYYEIFKVN